MKNFLYKIFFIFIKSLLVGKLTLQSLIELRKIILIENFRTPFLFAIVLNQFCLFKLFFPQASIMEPKKFHFLHNLTLGSYGTELMQKHSDLLKCKNGLHKECLSQQTSRVMF